MISNKIYRLVIFLLLVLSGFGSCKKGFLNASPNNALAVPETQQDFQSLLDNQNIYYNNPGLGDMSSDDYYTDYSYLGSLYYLAPDCYTWSGETYAGGAGTEILDWNGPYASIYTANVVLDALPQYPPAANTQATWNSLKGQALYYVAFNYYNLAQIFSPPYKAASATTDLGLPIRTSGNLDQSSSRSSLQDTYGLIINDLLLAKDLLPASVATSFINRPSKPAALAMLARTYLVMGDYSNAWKYADSCLQFYNTLIDYNTVNSPKLLPFPRPPAEVLIQAFQIDYNMLDASIPNAHVDSTLYSSYDSNDLRKSIFFKIDPSSGLPYFRGNYSNLLYLFCGTAVDEIYLIRAECNARGGNAVAAMTDLNTLLSNRWKTGTFTPYSATGASDALRQILQERRKELCFRGLRWTDLRRLNMDPNYAITLTRILNGTTYSLPPNDPRYTLLIPLDEIKLSGIQQNGR